MSKLSILIVEDEAIVALEIKREIEKLGYHVAGIATNYTQALQSVYSNKPNIILVDIRLKGEKSGIDLLTTIQKKNPIPHIYLTSDERESTIIQAASTNPSAYLNKPFRREELRSNLLITIHATQTISILQPYTTLGKEHHYDHSSQTLFYQNQPIHLSNNETLLLSLLIDAQGTTIPTQVIEEYIWGSFIPIASSGLRTLIYRLRSKTGLEIETVSKYGYRLKKDG